MLWNKQNKKLNGKQNKEALKAIKALRMKENTAIWRTTKKERNKERKKERLRHGALPSWLQQNLPLITSLKPSMYIRYELRLTINPSYLLPCPLRLFLTPQYKRRVTNTSSVCFSFAAIWKHSFLWLPQGDPYCREGLVYPGPVSAADEVLCRLLFYRPFSCLWKRLFAV